ncbi:MAG: ATP-binding protein [Treponema sp.]|jgi:signal transduction histidine kinase|nr:ATP-binding protein [Treponema sp.]
MKKAGLFAAIELFNNFSISLQNRLALTYALFISLALAALTITINVFTGLIFTTLVKNNITEKSAEIVRVISDQYNPMLRSFNALTIEAIGMYFVHEGYIVTVENEEGDLVWDARACDMRECMTVINDIAVRMQEHIGANGALRRERYPIQFAGRMAGSIIIETYGPFFYSETESAFLTSINRLLFFAAIMLTIASFAVSIILSRAIARPINKSAEAARRIAQTYSTWAAHNAPGARIIRIDDQYQTKELAELARSINALSAKLEEGERRQKQLTGDIAHELRTPITCLQGDIEAMLDGVYKPDKEHLESCHEEVIRLAGLVRDLNTLTNVEWENITLNKTEFDLASLLRITAEQFKAAALEKNIAIRLDLIESQVIADYDRLKQVFINLLSNAIKYTDTGSITVRIEKAEEPKHVSVWVSDTGIGIPEDDLPHIFERLYRTDKSRSRSTGGAGIGLAIAAAIIAAHGGTITAESAGSGGVGTTFRVVL